jgi:cytochrome c oxidase subunit III
MADQHGSSHGSHGQQAHPYHLVNPSPWPFVASMSLLALTLGAAMAMHKTPGGIPLSLVGLAGVLFVMFSWWRDVIREGLVDRAHTYAVSHGLRLGMVLFIISEVMFFAAFFWAFFDASLFPKHPLEDVWAIMEGVWPPSGITPFDPWHLPFLNTLILLLSGTTVTWAHYALLQDDREGLVTGLGLTVLLGATFTALQAFEYSHAAFGFKDGVYASTFYLATGFHGLHVLIGTIFLFVCWLRAKSGTLTKEGHLGFEFAAWYWHFVDVVWLFLFVCIYWWGGQ